MEFLTRMKMNKPSFCVITWINLINNVVRKKSDMKGHILYYFLYTKLKIMPDYSIVLQVRTALTLEEKETDWERSMERGGCYLFVCLGGGLWRCVHCVKFIELHTYDLCTFLICVVTKMLTKMCKSGMEEE